MAKRKFNPLPQTVRIAEGQLFRCLFRVKWTARGPGEREWKQLGMPWGPESTHWEPALNLTKALAENLVRRHRAAPHGKMFEYKIEPMKETK